MPTERFVAFLPPSPSVAVDRESGRVYAAFQDGGLGDADVLLWTLPGGDEAWQGPTRVNDTRRRDGTAQYLPKLSVASDGRLDVVYYDRRDDPRSDGRTETSFQTSFDEGTTFTASERLTDRGFDSRVGFGTERGLPDLGSRIGLVSTDSGALAVWTGTRAGTTTTLKQDPAERVVAIAEPQELPGPTEALLRWGGALLALVGVALLATWLAATLRPTPGSSVAPATREAGAIAPATASTERRELRHGMRPAFCPFAARLRRRFGATVALDGGSIDAEGRSSGFGAGAPNARGPRWVVDTPPVPRSRHRA